MMVRGRSERRLVLIGGGHAHVVVLRSLGMKPVPGLEVVLVAKELDAPYSGMLPGYVAGHYDLDGCHIDLVRLAHFAGARLIHGEADGIDRQQRTVSISGRRPIAYDLVSIDTGITPSIGDISGAAEHAVAVKPVSSFAPHWRELEARALAPGGPRRIAIVGTGAAGFELVLAIRHRLRALAPVHGIDPDSFSFALVGSGRLLPTHNQTARRLAGEELRRQRVELVTGDAAVAVAADHIRLASGRLLGADATLITTKAAPPAWFAATGLPLDEAGFLAVRPTLQALDDDDVFAVGDCASVLEHPREKAGVFAVRQGPPLTENIRLRAAGRPAQPFTPQRQFMTLLSCGDRTAIAARGSLAARGAWAWWLKDHIDRRFMTRFQHLPPVAEAVATGPDALLCAGCAAKLGPMPLAAALSRFASEPALPDRGPTPARIANLAGRDDAALLDLGGDRLRLESLDFFPAIWPEPFVLGEIAAAHALGDIVAKGGAPDHALALAALPPGAANLQQDDLFQLLAGARSVLEREGASIVGGHTLRAETLGIGFFVSGSIERDALIAKGGLAAGQALVLTKPLGTGILFAAWMRRRARALEVAAALAGMRRTSTAAARILAEHGATGATDVTGFGLAGHLLEMLDAARLGATIDLAAVPTYPGTRRLIAEGLRSSLLADNLAVADRIALAPGIAAEPALALLLDPQTSGGLVAGVPEAEVATVLVRLAEAGLTAARIGTVEAGRSPGDAPVLRVTDGATRRRHDADPPEPHTPSTSNKPVVNT